MQNESGIILIDKPRGFTSFDVVAVMRGATHIKRTGHAGTLDPMATGVLPLLFGRAAKFCDLLPRSDKRYTATLQLGITTDTLDITGEILAKKDFSVSDEAFEKAIKQFRGKIKQTPPMYSAVKVGGRKLCDVARRGGEVKREQREVEIHSLNCINSDPEKGEFTLDVACSKGTYIRSLADDIGKTLGCGAVLTGLRRTSACGFDIKDCIPLEKARNTPFEFMLPPDAGLNGYRRVDVSEAQSKRFCNGGRLSFDKLNTKDIQPEEIVRIYSESGEFAGLGKANDEEIAVLVIMKINQNNN